MPQPQDPHSGPHTAVRGPLRRGHCPSCVHRAGREPPVRGQQGTCAAVLRTCAPYTTTPRVRPVRRPVRGAARAPETAASGLLAAVHRAPPGTHRSHAIWPREAARTPVWAIQKYVSVTQRDRAVFWVSQGASSKTQEGGGFGVRKTYGPVSPIWECHPVGGWTACHGLRWPGAERGPPNTRETAQAVLCGGREPAGGTAPKAPGCGASNSVKSTHGTALYGEQGGTPHVDPRGVDGRRRDAATVV